MKDVQELAKEGRMYVSYPSELRTGVEEAVSAWKAFCELPRETKLQLPYEPDSKSSGSGYELKEGNTYDLKENFHLRETFRSELMKHAQTVDANVAPQFIEKALALPSLIAPLVRKFAEAAEKEFDMPGFANDVVAEQPRWLVRFLHYFGDRAPGEETATPHNDKGGFTLHLYESAPGVERLTYDTKEWVSMPLSEGETVIIAGNGLQQRSRCKLRALSHRVVATEETAKDGRYAAVCFFAFRNQRFFDKAKFGAQQAWAPGAFYDMPFEEFDRFFID